MDDFIPHDIKKEASVKEEMEKSFKEFGERVQGWNYLVEIKKQLI